MTPEPTLTGVWPCGRPYGDWPWEPLPGVPPLPLPFPLAERVLVLARAGGAGGARRDNRDDRRADPGRRRDDTAVRGRGRSVGRAARATRGGGAWCHELRDARRRVGRGDGDGGPITCAR